MAKVKTAVFCQVPAAYTAVFGTRIDHVLGPCTAVYTVCTRPRAAVHSLYTAAVQTVYMPIWPCTGHVHGPSVTVYTAVFTARVHGGVRTVYMAVYTAVHGVYGSCTPACNSRVHSASTAVYRVHIPRPCLRPVHGPRTWSVRDPITAVYAARARPCTVNTAVFTARVHGIVRTVYTTVHGVYGSCTPACKGRVHGASTAMYRVQLHGWVLCTRPCLRPVYTAAHGRVQTVYTAVHRPRTWSVRDPITTVYAARTRPCTVNTAVFTTVCTALYVPSTEFMQCQSMRQILPNINHAQYS